MNNTIISFSKVSKTYPGNPLPSLGDVSFEVLDGEFFCIVGPSGCGKSTVLKIIADLETISAGEIIKPDEVAMVFQSGALLPWLPVYENVALGLKARNENEAKIITECQKYIELTGLLAFEQKYPRDLSGGQRQRVGLARALAVNPKVLLLDEPFSALDAGTTEELHKDLIKIWKATKKTIIMVSHLMEEEEFFGERRASGAAFLRSRSSEHERQSAGRSRGHHGADPGDELRRNAKPQAHLHLQAGRCSRRACVCAQDSLDAGASRVSRTCGSFGSRFADDVLRNGSQERRLRSRGSERAARDAGHAEVPVPQRAGCGKCSFRSEL